MNAKQIILGALMCASAVTNAAPVRWELATSTFSAPEGAAQGGPVIGNFTVNGDALAGERVNEIISFDFVINGRSYGLNDVTAWFDRYVYTIGLGERGLTAGTHDFEITIGTATDAATGAPVAEGVNVLYAMEGSTAIYAGTNYDLIARSAIPEPATCALFGLGFALIGIVARRKR